MKQLIKTAAIVMASVFTLSTSFAATKTTNNDDVNISFRHDFQNARLMSTEVKDNFTKVTFAMNQQIMTAFYATNGDLLCVTRNIVSSDLPVGLLMSFKKHYSEYWVTDLFEMSQDAQSNYYLSLENADVKMTLRSNGSNWELFSTTKK